MIHACARHLTFFPWIPYAGLPSDETRVLGPICGAGVGGMESGPWLKNRR